MPTINGVRFLDYRRAAHPSGLYVSVYDYGGLGYNYSIFGELSGLKAVLGGGENDLLASLVTAKREAAAGLYAYMFNLAERLRHGGYAGFCTDPQLSVKLAAYATELWSYIEVKKAPPMLKWVRITEDLDER